MPLSHWSVVSSLCFFLCLYCYYLFLFPDVLSLCCMWPSGGSDRQGQASGHFTLVAVSRACMAERSVGPIFPWLLFSPGQPLPKQNQLSSLFPLSLDRSVALVLWCGLLSASPWPLSRASAVTVWEPSVLPVSLGSAALPKEGATASLLPPVSLLCFCIPTLIPSDFQSSQPRLWVQLVHARLSFLIVQAFCAASWLSWLHRLMTAAVLMGGSRVSGWLRYSSHFSDLT